MSTAAPCLLLPHVCAAPRWLPIAFGCGPAAHKHLVMLRWSMLVCMHVPVITSALNCQCTNSVGRARVKGAQREILANLGGCTCAKGKAVSSVEYTVPTVCARRAGDLGLIPLNQACLAPPTASQIMAPPLRASACAPAKCAIWQTCSASGKSDIVRLNGQTEFSRWL